MDLTILLLLILLNGVFAMSEIALVTARKARLGKHIEAGDAAALAAVRLGEDPTRFLSTIQIGITSIGILNGIVGEAALAPPLAAELVAWGADPELAGYGSTALVVVVVTYLSIVVGELVPKRIGQTRPEMLARLVARPIEWLTLAAKPFVVLLTVSTGAVLKLLGVKEGPAEPVTEEEIHAVLAEGRSAGVIEVQEHAMVRNVFRLDERQIGSLMVPRADVAVLDVDLPFEENLARIDASEHALIPVTRGGLDNVLGILDARRWLVEIARGEARALDQQPLEEALYVPETLTGMELLENFRGSGVQLAFVVDEYGEVLGVVSVHDLIEAITGEFRPRDPADAWAVARADGSWLLDGHIPIPELKDRLQLRAVPDEERGRYHTLSGMLMLLTGRVPSVADCVDWEDWRLEIVDMDGKTIDKVLATRLPEAPPPSSTVAETGGDS